MSDNPFNTPLSGQADWDSGLGVNFQTLERGYHVTERAGQTISSGQMVALNSGAFAFPWNPSSTPPCAGIAYTAAASGDSFTFLAWGIVRSLGINSVSVPGKLLFSNASGFLSVATLGAPVALGLSGYGVLFQPSKVSGAAGATPTLGALADVNTTGIGAGKLLAWDNVTSKWIITAPAGGALAALTDVNTNGVSDGKVLQWADVSSRWVPVTPTVGATKLATLTDVNTNGVSNGKIISWDDTTSKWIATVPASTSHRVQSVQIAAVTNSTHTFTMSLGAALFGWNRRVRVNGSSLASIELRFYRDSGRSDLQYQSVSGGFSAVTSFHDRAGWPVDTDSGTIYGSLQVFSTSVGSDTINIIADWEV